MNKTFLSLTLLAVLFLWVQGCHPKLETVNKIEVAPMHITIDVNVKVDRALDNFFDDLDKTQAKIKPSTP